jgi:hypothetical protein
MPVPFRDTGARISVEAIPAASPEARSASRMMMNTTFKFAKFAGIVALCLISLNMFSLNLAVADSAHSQRKAKKPPLPPLPSGPTGPVPQMPLDSIAPVAPQVSYQNGELTIVAPNSTLADILRAVRKQTGAEIEIPEARERVVTHLGPGPARAVMAELLNGSRFNYVLLGSPQDASGLTRVVLVAKTPDSTGNTGGANANNPAMQQPPPVMNQVVSNPPTQEQIDDGEAEENAPADDSAEPAEAEQAQPPAEQPEVKTPQQMLQEMQQRQLQLQQQQPPGQPPIPGPGVPVRPPQEQQ